MKNEQQTGRELNTGSILTAYGALSALLLLAAAIALFEAAIAIRKKLTQCLENNGDDRHQLNNNNDCDRKTVLSSCCLKYKRRERIPVQKIQHRRFSIQPQRVTPAASPQISITSTNNTSESLSGTYQTVYNPCEVSNRDDSQWLPLSRLKHMGAPHFNNPSRRVSSPDWTGKHGAWKGSRPSVVSVDNQLSLTDRPARRSVPGQAATSVFPLTPGVARLSNSLLDCYNGHQVDVSSIEAFQENPARLYTPQASPRLLLCYQRPISVFESGANDSEIIQTRPQLQRFSIQETPLIFKKTSLLTE